MGGTAPVRRGGAKGSTKAWPRVRSILALAVAFASTIVLTSPGADAGGTPREIAGLTMRRIPTQAEAKQWFGPGKTLEVEIFPEQRSGLPVVSAATNRIYQAYTLLDPVTFQKELAFLVRDLGTLEIIGSFTLPNLAGPTGGVQAIQDSFPGTLPVVFDAANRRMYLYVRRYVGAGGVGLNGSETAGFLALDERAIRTGRKPAIARPAPHRFIPVGLSGGNVTGDPTAGAAGIGALEGFAFADGKLYALATSAGRARLMQINAASGAIDWRRPVRGCESIWHDSVGAIQKAGYATVLVTKDAFFVPCQANSAAAVVRVAKAEVTSPNGAEQVYRGQGVPKGYLVDAAARRIHILVSTLADLSVLTFDAQQGAFVGLQRASQDPYRAAFGMDQNTGRVYTMSEKFAPDQTDGLGQIDGRWTPVEPGSRMRQHTYNADFMPIVLATDPIRRRVLVPTSKDKVDQVFKAIGSPPPDQEPPDEDPDRNTQGIAPEEGVTASSASGEVGGYGARSLIVGGLRGLTNRQLSVTTPEAILNNTGAKMPVCYWTNRDIVLGRVTEASLAGTLRAATATAADADAFTRQDVELPSRCREVTYDLLGIGTEMIPAGTWAPADQGVNSQGRKWPYATVACRPGKPTETHEPSDAGLKGSSSRVDCTEEKVSAVARFRPLGQATPPPGVPNIVVGEAFSEVSTDLAGDKGTISKVTSFARGIDLAGQVQIEGIRAVATAKAGGRKGSASTTYERVLFGVRTADFDCRVCASPQQQADAVAAMNRALDPLGMEVRLPGADLELAAGSPGGYQAAIQRDELQAITTRIVNGDELTELPALEVLRYNDTAQQGRQRQIFQFAGVKANAQFGIFCLRGLGDDGTCRAATVPAAFGGGPLPTDDAGNLGTRTKGVPGRAAIPDEYVTEAIDGEEVAARTLDDASSGGGIGEFLRKVLGAPAEVMRLIMRNPGQALLFAASAVLMGAPFWVARRRRLLATVVTYPTP